MPNQKFIFIIVLLHFCCINLAGQYYALEANLNWLDGYEKVNDDEYDYNTTYNSALSIKEIGVSFPISDHILLSPKLGRGQLSHGFSRDRYHSSFGQDSLSAFNSHRIKFAKIGIEAIFFPSEYYQRFYLNVELQGLINYNAESSLWAAEAGVTIREDEYDISDKIRGFIPSVRLGMGYNLALWKYINVFINVFTEVKDRPVYYETENYSKIRTGCKGGIKIVLGGKSAGHDHKKRDRSWKDSFRNWF